MLFRCNDTQNGKAKYQYYYVEYSKLINMGLRGYVIALMRKRWHLIECQLRINDLEKWWNLECGMGEYRYTSLSMEGTSREAEAEELAETARKKRGWKILMTRS